MEKKELVKGLRLLSFARQYTTDSEYNVLSYIREAVSYSTFKKNQPYVHLNRQTMLEHLGVDWYDESWSSQKIKRKLDKLSKVTSSLEEKGFIIKKKLYNPLNNKSAVYFTLNYAILEQVLIETDAKSDEIPVESNQKSGVYNTYIHKQINKYNTSNKQYTSSTEDNLEDASFDEDDLSFLK